MSIQLIHRLSVAQALFAFCLLSKDVVLAKRITTEDVESALESGMKMASEKEKLKSLLIAKGVFLNPNVISAEARHQLGNKMSIPSSERAQSVLESASVDLVSRLGLSNDEAADLTNLQLNGELGRMVVQECNDNTTTNCDTDSIYRTINGSCNNIQRPNEGRIFSCLLRLAPSDYEDGVSEPRNQNNSLPNPRDVSVMIHRIVPANRETNAPFTSGIHSIFGQFADHDMEFTTQPTPVNNAPINCCNTTDLHPQCFPIPLRNDPDFTSDCMNLVRDAICPYCKLGRREQMNSLTSYIDCSQIYGTTDEQAAILRNNVALNDGKLNSTIISGVGERPPPSVNPETDQCSRPGFPCFLVGDFRANQNPLLSAHHIMFLIVHNQIVDRLTLLNPHWDGERKYQETRRIVAACFQHIIYQEYLPLVIGEETMEAYSLRDYDTQYDNRIAAVVINEFAVAAFRFGHSTVMDTIWIITEDGQQDELQLRDNFFNPTIMYQPGGLEDVVRGGTRQPQKRFDNNLVRAVTQFLYRRLNTTQGLDLAALNIQRGRDHGVPGYTTYLSLIHKINITSFDELREYFLPICFESGLEKLYRSVEDIDLWTGLLCETTTPDALVGMTTKRIIGLQFHNLKYGDRFFYTHTGLFTRDQLKSISRVSLARIICNALKLPEISEAVFEYSSPIFYCSDFERIPPLDLEPWRESSS